MKRMVGILFAVGAIALPGVVSAQPKGLPRAADAAAAPVFRTISGNPLTIHVGDDTSFQVYNATIPGSGQIYPTGCAATADMGAFIRRAGVLFAPSFSTHTCGTATSGIGTYTAWTPVSISAVTGTGTAGDPFQVIVVANAAATGVQLTMTVRYVNGENYFRKSLAFASPSASTFDVFFGADIYLASDDDGVPYREPASGSPGGQSCVPPTYTILLIPLTPAQFYSANSYGTVWSQIGAGALPSTVATGCRDNGAALQWKDVTVPAGGSTTIQVATSFGTIPVITQFRVDSVTPAQGNQGQDLTVTVTGIGFQAGTTFDFGAGITVGTTTIVSPTQATVSLSISASAAFGFRDVVGTQAPAGLTSTLTNGFEVGGSFRVDSVVPRQGNQGQDLTVTVTGIGFLAGTTFDFGAGITEGTTTIISSTQATVALSIAPFASVGFRNVLASQSPGGRTSSLTNGFEVLATGDPVIPTLSGLGLALLSLALAAAGLAALKGTSLFPAS